MGLLDPHSGRGGVHFPSSPLPVRLPFLRAQSALRAAPRRQGLVVRVLHSSSQRSPCAGQRAHLSRSPVRIAIGPRPVSRWAGGAAITHSARYQRAAKQPCMQRLTCLCVRPCACHRLRLLPAHAARRPPHQVPPVLAVAVPYKVHLGLAVVQGRWTSDGSWQGRCKCDACKQSLQYCRRSCAVAAGSRAQPKLLPILTCP